MDENFTPQEPMQDPNLMQPEVKPKKKKSKFGKGVFYGIVIGFALCLVVGFVSIRLYVNNTGKFIVIGAKSATSVTSAAIVDEETAEKIDELSSYIDLYYTGDFTEDELQDGLLHGLVSALGDPYSVYYNAEEYTDLQISSSGNYAGIGAGLSQDADTMEVTVTRIYEGTPSEEAGLLKDDVILTVDGTDSTSMELSDLVNLIRGDEGTTVTLEVYRPSTGKTFTVDVERKNITLPSVNYSMLENNIGYIQITQFQADTAEQFDQALADLQSQGMEKVIFDVRDNPGGYLTSVTDILDTILPEGITVYTEDKYGNRKNYNSDANCIDCPIVVLVNGNSASASEIFAGAIKDYEYGTLIGTNTFGKGIVQSIFDLNNGCGLKLTTANYYTPNGNFIHGVGIAPDIELEYEFLGEDGESYSQDKDNQLIYAIQYLNGETE